MTSLTDNYNEILGKIRAAAQKGGRRPEDVTVLPVTKTHPPGVIMGLKPLGLRVIGESRVQEFKDKYDALRDHFDFHFIGHLQTNKVKPAVAMSQMIETVDSLRLAGAISAECEKQGREMDVLIQVNTSFEEAKSGVSPEGLMPLVKDIARLPHIHLKGLMTMAMATEDLEKARLCFRLLKTLEGQVNREGIDNAALTTLSMGMSGDYEAAVEEGATLVRIGSALFGGRA